MNRARSARPHTIGLVLFSCFVTLSLALPTVNAAAPRAQTTITMWSGISGPDQQAFVPLVNAFNATQSQYHIEYDQQSYSNYAQKLAAAISSGSPPTIFTQDNAQSRQMAYDKSIMSVDRLLKANKALAPGKFANGSIPAVTWKKHIWGVPLDVTPLVMYYNKKLFRQAGLNPNKPPIADRKTFLRAAKKLTRGNRYGVVIPEAFPMPYIWQTMVRQFGGVLFDTKKVRSGINTAAGYNALKFLYDLVWTWKYSPKNVVADQDLKMLTNDTAAMILDGSYQLSNPVLQSLGTDLGVSTVPKFGTKSTVFLGSLYFDLSAKATPAQQKGAAAWFAFFEAHSGSMGALGDLSSYKPVINSTSYRRLKHTVVINRALKTGYWPVFYPNLDTHWQITDAVYPVLLGQETDIRAALAKAAGEITGHVRNPSG